VRARDATYTPLSCDWLHATEETETEAFARKSKSKCYIAKANDYAPILEQLLLLPSICFEAFAFAMQLLLDSNCLLLCTRPNVLTITRSN
jgi:hypothetical protein